MSQKTDNQITQDVVAEFAFPAVTFSCATRVWAFVSSALNDAGAVPTGRAPVHALYPESSLECN